MLNRFTLVIMTLFAALTVRANTIDSGTSTNLLVKYNLNEDWYLKSISNMSTRNGIDDIAIMYGDLTLGRNFTDNWSLDAGYRHARIRVGTHWREEFRPVVNLSWKDTIEGFSISNRSRMEFRLFEDSSVEDRLRFRNELRVVSPWKVPGTEARLYMEEEFFYETNGDGFNLNWLTGGVQMKLGKGVVGKIGYRWQDQKFGNNWRTRHVLVTGLMVFL